LKILANEKIAGCIIRTLRERGHDVLSVKESMRGASDGVCPKALSSDVARVRYCDADSKRPGLPEDIAALVEKLAADLTIVRLVNISPSLIPLHAIYRESRANA